jgi:hypothetical protein
MKLKTSLKYIVVLPKRLVADTKRPATKPKNTATPFGGRNDIIKM